MKLLSLIMTHRDVLSTVTRHVSIWTKLPGRIQLTSPTSFGMTGYLGTQELQMGVPEHHGEKSAQRITQIIKYALDREDWTHLLLMEYDSFALDLPEEVMPPEGGVSAALYPQNKPVQFIGRFYLHYPMLFTREGLSRTYEELPRVKTKDRYYSDRFIGMAVELAKIPINNLRASGKSYSKNTIREKHYKELNKAVRGGALFFHGVKDNATLQVILQSIEP